MMKHEATAFGCVAYHMRELASRGGKAKRHKEDTQPRNVTHWDGTPERHVPYRPPRSRRRRPHIIRFFLSEEW